MDKADNNEWKLGKCWNKRIGTKSRFFSNMTLKFECFKNIRNIYKKKNGNLSIPLTIALQNTDLKIGPLCIPFCFLITGITMKLSVYFYQVNKKEKVKRELGFFI